jgi:hypothetical protein
MIPTAEEFMDNQGINEKELQNLPWFDYGNLLTWLEDYSNLKAKFHVEAALKAASENAYVEYIDLDTNEIFDYTDVITDDNVGADVNKKSILNAYPLENIK